MNNLKPLPSFCPASFSTSTKILGNVSTQNERSRNGRNNRCSSRQLLPIKRGTRLVAVAPYLLQLAREIRRGSLLVGVRWGVKISVVSLSSASSLTEVDAERLHPRTHENLYIPCTRCTFFVRVCVSRIRVSLFAYTFASIYIYIYTYTDTLTHVRKRVCKPKVRATRKDESMRKRCTHTRRGW